MKKVLFFILLLAAVKPGSAQLLDSIAFDTVKVYESIAEANKQPDKVIKLVLHKDKLTAFPEDIRKYTNLQYLDLSKNRLKKVPAWIGELKSLQFLILSRNDIDTLPREIGGLENLKYFIINRTNLVSLPPEIGNLKNLQYLDMWDDNLDEFPSDLGKLTNLRVLDLRDILISDEVQAQLKSYLPHAQIFFSPNCACKD
jgi:Leucine-rich repeat (LRR) protein